MIHKIISPVPFPEGTVNSYLIKDDALSIVDVGTKTPEALEAIKKGIKDAGYQMEDIEQVILTHHHPDHVGWIDAFPNAKVLGHIYVDAWLRRDPVFINSHYDFYLDRLKEEGVPEEYYFWAKKMTRSIEMLGERTLTDVIHDGDEIPGHKGLIAIETLGHAQSHFVFWNEEKNAMIGGDLLIANISSNPLIEPPLNPKAKRAKSLLQYNASLKKLLTLPIDKIYSGHGSEITNVQELVRERLEKQHIRAMKVLKLLEERPKNIFQINVEIFPIPYKSQLGLTLSQTIGQIDYLLDQDLITEVKDENGVYWYAKK
ncbi:MBL fold metallo-hydrolase [Rummeliibacillus suwonensis]|jgi:Zn-dependent hydrolases, including glyoxylases|uniref:MBL fold metallo-hydrolase n=1 Tax=Rummeliibacillus suwonensis TaxID=1306154 RepID=UPI0011B376D0|nr:MBL fold metallo-hydrolase [Rummeliibacillus suwonensis]